MPKSCLMAVAFLGLGVYGVGADEPSTNPATWRYTVSAILNAQREGVSAPQSVGAIASADFAQNYERYSATGQRETPAVK